VLTRLPLTPHLPLTYLFIYFDCSLSWPAIVCSLPFARFRSWHADAAAGPAGHRLARCIAGQQLGAANHTPPTIQQPPPTAHLTSSGSSSPQQWAAASAAPVVPQLTSSSKRRCRASGRRRPRATSDHAGRVPSRCRRRSCRCCAYVGVCQCAGVLVCREFEGDPHPRSCSTCLSACRRCGASTGTLRCAGLVWSSYSRPLQPSNCRPSHAWSCVAGLLLLCLKTPTPALARSPPHTANKQQPHYGGDKVIWDAIKAAVAAPDMATTRLLLEAAGVIVARPDMTVMYDERGALGWLRVFVVWVLPSCQFFGRSLPSLTQPVALWQCHCRRALRVAPVRSGSPQQPRARGRWPRQQHWQEQQRRPAAASVGSGRGAVAAAATMTAGVWCGLFFFASFLWGPSWTVLTEDTAGVTLHRSGCNCLLQQQRLHSHRPRAARVE
jgi:hypothetical protein